MLLVIIISLTIVGWSCMFFLLFSVWQSRGVRRKQKSKLRPLQAFLLTITVLYAFAIVRFAMTTELPGYLHGIGLILAVGVGVSRHHLIVSIITNFSRRNYHVWVEWVPMILVFTNYFANQWVAFSGNRTNPQELLHSGFAFDFEGVIPLSILLSLVTFLDLVLILDQYYVIWKRRRTHQVSQTIVNLNHLISGGIIIRALLLFVIARYLSSYQALALLSAILIHMLVIGYLLSESMGQLKFLLPQSVRSDVVVDNLWDELMELLSMDNIVQRKALTVADISIKLGTTEKNLRLAMKAKSSMSFPTMVNMFRLKLFVNQARHHGAKYTIEAMAYNVGFASRNTFYSFCQKHVGMRPKEIIDNPEINQEYLFKLIYK